MGEIREAHVRRIDAAQQALTAARDSGDQRAVAQADEVLNAAVRNSSQDELQAWAAVANRRDGW